MEITFLGVGEACDPAQPNTSLLINTTTEGGGRQLLLDCGFTIPHLYFAGCNDPEQLDLLWISHFHGDYFFGVPLLQLRFLEMGRRKRQNRDRRQEIETILAEASGGSVFLPVSGDKLTLG